MVSIERIKTGVSTEDTCPICKQKLVLITTFGKQVCRFCYLSKPHRKGHSGMIKLSQQDLEKELNQTRVQLYDIELQPVSKGNKVFATLYLTHYPGSLGIIGRSLCYLIFYKNRIAGIIAGNSPPKLRVIKNNFPDNSNLYNELLNNCAFRLIQHEDNLATRVLALWRRRVKKDYEQKYKTKLRGLITFVEPPLSGICYKADNWSYLGLTKGIHVTRRDKLWVSKKYTKGKQKHIYIYKYRE